MVVVTISTKLNVMMDRNFWSACLLSSGRMSGSKEVSVNLRCNPPKGQSIDPVSSCDVMLP